MRKHKGKNKNIACVGMAMLISGMLGSTARATTAEEMMGYMDDHVQHLRPWSWDTPARMITVRDGAEVAEDGTIENYTTEQIDLICQNSDVGGEEAFKEYYPGILANIGYMNLEKDTRSYHLEGHFATNPEDYLYYADGSPRVGGSDAPYFNLASATCREWWLSQAAEQIDGYEYQGNSFFIDALAKVGGVVGDDLYDYWGNPVSGESYWDACALLLDEARDRFADKVLLAGNFARPGTERTQWSLDYLHISFMESFEDFGDYVETAHDAIGIMEELTDVGGMVQVTCGAANKPTPCTELTLDEMRAKAEAAMPEIWAEYTEDERDILAANYAYFDFKLAYFLMAAHDRCYFRVRDAKTLADAGTDMYRIVMPFPEWDMALGSPLEDAQRDRNVYTRRFQHVEVMVNFDDGTCSFTPRSGGFGAYSKMEAEDYTSQSGIQTQTTTDIGVGENVGWINDGDWIKFDDVEFGAGAVSIDARVASRLSGGTIELRLGSTTGTLIGTVDVPKTGGWQDWETVTADVSGVSGTEDLVLVFTGGFNLNWFKFTSVPDNDAPIGDDIWLQAIANGLYVCADKGISSYAPLCANRTSYGTWERFTVEDAGDGYCALKAKSNGKYVSADTTDANVQLQARYTSTSIGDMEKFVWILNNDGTMSLQTYVNGRYVCADAGVDSEEVPLCANRDSVSAWERFLWGDN